MKKRWKTRLKADILDRGFRSNLRSLFSDGMWALRYSFRHKPWMVAGMLVLAVVSSSIPALLAISTRGLVNTVSAMIGGRTTNDYQLFYWLLIGLAAAVLDATITLLENYLTQTFQDTISRFITLDVLEHTSHLDLEQLEDLQFQDTLSIAQANTGSTFSNFLSLIITLVSTILESIILAGLLFQIDLIILPVFIPIMLGYFWYEWRHVVRRTELEQLRTTNRRWTRYFTSRLTTPASLPEIKLLGLGPLLLRKFDELLKQFIGQDRRLRRSVLFMQSVYAVTTSGLVTFLLWRTVMRIRDRLLTIGDLTIFGSAALRLRRNIELIVLQAGNALEDTIYISHIRVLLQTQPQLTLEGRLKPEGVRGDLKMERVSFSYPGSVSSALDRITLHIRTGEVVALVGENGAGKTTLIKLLSGLYAPTTGRILLDGRPLESYDQDFLYQQFSFVFQPYGRYEGTVHENIAYGDWTRLLNDPEAVKAVGRSCGMDPMIRRLPQGYETMLGRMFGEVDLSGGQWQKIAIARAFARDGSIVVLDEPTSSLDPRAEFEVYSLFRSLARNRTAIIISHRFSTVSMADRIIVMNDGRIVEEGSHPELMRAKGVYAALYTMQSKQMNTLRKEH
jgi:ATP-binding cassette, subfamily B, bacterial